MEVKFYTFLWGYMMILEQDDNENLKKLKNMPISNALVVCLSAATRLYPVFDRVSQELIPENKGFIFDLINQLWMEVLSPSLTKKQFSERFKILDSIYNRFEEHEQLKYSYVNFTLEVIMHLPELFQEKNYHYGSCILSYPTDTLYQFIGNEFWAPATPSRPDQGLSDMQQVSFPPYQEELLRQKRDFKEIGNLKEPTCDILARLKTRAWEEGEELAKLICHEIKYKWCPYSEKDCPCPAAMFLATSYPCTCPLTESYESKMSETIQAYLVKVFE